MPLLDPVELTWNLDGLGFSKDVGGCSLNTNLGPLDRLSFTPYDQVEIRRNRGLTYG